MKSLIIRKQTITKGWLEIINPCSIRLLSSQYGLFVKPNNDKQALLKVPFKIFS